MRQMYYISLVTNQRVAQLFSDTARAKGLTTSDFLRLIVRNALKKSGYREYHLIPEPYERDLSAKKMKGQCLQAAISREAKEAFRHYANTVQMRDMQKALRVLVYEELKKCGNEVAFSDLYKDEAMRV